MDDKKVDVVIKFKKAPASGFMLSLPGFEDELVKHNELVLQLQPGEKVPASYFRRSQSYISVTNALTTSPFIQVVLGSNIKSPGFRSIPFQTSLDLLYSDKFSDVKVPEAYTRLMLDVLDGKQSAFVRRYCIFRNGAFLSF